jgi:hypothetical protein
MNIALQILCDFLSDYNNKCVCLYVVCVHYVVMYICTVLCL